MTATMRTPTILALLLSSALLNAQSLAGQWLVPPDSASPQVAHLEYSMPIPQLEPEIAGSPSWRNRILTGAGAAAVGAFLGFFASEVAVGDWDVRDGAHEPARSVWAAVGGSIGLAMGFKFPITGDASRGGMPPGPRNGRLAILAEEIEEASLANAYDAVSLLRPQWLVGRGRDTFTEFGTDNIRVYLNTMELGGVESLREVEAHIITSIRFHDALRATALFGAGHVHGVIQVLTNN